MRETTFQKPVNEVITTLTEIFRHQGRGEIVELLESAHAHFDETDYDNWNGGTYTWALRLEVPVPVFASFEPRLSNIEKEISMKLSYFGRLYPNDHLGEVTVSPITPGALMLGQRMAPSELEVRRLWSDGQFRLFLSHVSEHRTEVFKLQQELALRGVAAFVAHKDIVPSLEWRNEIELGLRSMHALAALITPNFHDSLWTDQEIGWAFGRGILVLPVRMGVDPYGFAGKYQGLSGTLEQPSALASSIVKALLVNPQTHGEMRRSLVNSLGGATSFAMTRALRAHVVEVIDFTEEEKASLQKACAENRQVYEAFGVPDAICKAIGKPVTSKVQEVDDTPF